MFKVVDVCSVKAFASRRVDREPSDKIRADLCRFAMKSFKILYSHSLAPMNAGEISGGGGGGYCGNPQHTHGDHRQQRRK